ncbi:hypothetical protein V8F06_000374 [Rhypophila decipiens]
MEPGTKGNIEWTSPPNSWLLDYAYAWAFIFEGIILILIFAFLAPRDRDLDPSRMQYFGGYIARHASIILFLCFAPSSAFLLSYTCDPSPPDVSGVSDMFGQGAYLGWLFAGIGTLIQHEIYRGGRFFRPRWRQANGEHDYVYSEVLGSDPVDQIGDASHGDGHVNMTRTMLNRAQDFGYDSLGFFIATCVAMAYFVVQVRAGKSGPMVEAPEHVVCYGCILSALLYLGALGLPAEPRRRKQTRMVGWGCLFLAGIIILSWKYSALVWTSSLVVLQVAWVGFLLLLMSSSFIAVSGWRRDGMLSTVLACVPSDLDDQGGFLINSTGFMGL